MVYLILENLNYTAYLKRSLMDLCSSKGNYLIISEIYQDLNSRKKAKKEESYNSLGTISSDNADEDEDASGNCGGVYGYESDSLILKVPHSARLLLRNHCI